MFEEGKQNFFAIEFPGRRREIDAAEPPAIAGPAAVHPRSHDQAVVDAGIVFADFVIRADRSHQILGVEPAADGQDGARDVLQVAPDRAGLPVLVVGRMREAGIPVFGATLKVAATVGDRADLQEKFVTVLRAVVEGGGGLRRQFGFGSRLEPAEKPEVVREHESAAVIPVVVEIEVGHGRLR